MESGVETNITPRLQTPQNRPLSADQRAAEKNLVIADLEIEDENAAIQALWQYDIRMLAKRSPEIVPHRFENEPDALAPDKFKGRHKINAPGDHNDSADCLPEGQHGHMQSNAHVDPFLRDVQVKIIVGQAAWLWA